MPYMNDYRYTIERDGEGVKIVVISPDKYPRGNKTFRLVRASYDALKAHMETLTDTQCFDWFAKRKEKNPYALHTTA